jgi:hypothetical protein
MNWKVVSVEVENGLPKTLTIENDAGEQHKIVANGKGPASVASAWSFPTLPVLPPLVTEKVLPAFAQGIGLGAGSYAGHAIGTAAGVAAEKVAGAIWDRWKRRGPR